MSLRAWRIRTKTSQSDLARMLGLRSRGHVSALENGREAVSADNAIKIDRLTGGEVPVRELRPDLHDVRVLHPGDPDPNPARPGVVHFGAEAGA